MQIERDVPLSSLTKFRVGGVAKHFARVTDADEVARAIAYAKERSLPYVILGGGSNVLVSDRGFDGLVIAMQLSTVEENEDSITAGAGCGWDALVARSVEEGRYGIENLSGIPGTVGGAIVGNIGAYGAEIKDSIVSVEALDPRTGSVRTISSNECRFGYRTSLFKEEEGKGLVVLSATFHLPRNGTLRTSYKDLERYEGIHGEIGSLARMREAILAIRSEKFPSDPRIGTAGSYFKNPIVSRSEAERFLSRFPDAPHYDEGEGRKKLSAAWIIDRVLKMRGAREGDVGTWESQALVIINHGNASANDIARFADRIIRSCEEETGIILVPEVVYIGDIDTHTTY